MCYWSWYDSIEEEERNLLLSEEERLNSEEEKRDDGILITVWHDHYINYDTSYSIHMTSVAVFK